MIDSLFSCCLTLFSISNKDELKKSSLIFKKETVPFSRIKGPKVNLKPQINIKTKNLGSFSDYLIDDIISPILVDLEDFMIKKLIGEGSFGRVFLVINTKDKQKYAMKVLQKNDDLIGNQMNKTNIEKNIMKKGEHPFVVKLTFSFQTKKKFFLIMDYMEGGDIFDYIQKLVKFNEETARFYCAEILLALDYLHEDLKIVYRDLKPENILLDSEGHIKLSDFGLSKSSENSYTLCGTPQYVAPEILLHHGHSNPVDVWSFGCLLYEMLTGRPPFNHKSKDQLFRQILESEPIFPKYISKQAKNLINACLKKNPLERISLNQIKKHEFFKGVVWEDFLLKKQLGPLKLLNESSKTENKLESGPKESVESNGAQNYANFNYKREKNCLNETDNEETI